jgi:two-component system sensor histidine kinase TtrS
MIKILRRFFGLQLVVVSLVFCHAAAAEDIRIALRAHKGSQKAMEQWQATADYLTEKIPGYRFIMVPFDNISALNQAVSRGKFHFCITNPASGVEYIIRYNAQPIATLVNKRHGHGYAEFGSVIFTRADRKDINNLKDLKGKTFIGVDELAFGGWRVAWKELLNNGINPYTDFKILRFGGGKQQEVVYAVRDGSADAGSVRTDMLERMAASGDIHLDNYKILGAKKNKEFPFLLSTALYPEWMFLTAKKIDNNLITQVVSALFSIPKESHAAIEGEYVGWISPLDYTPVENLLKDLKVGPYHVATMNPLQSLISQYGLILLITITVIILLVLTVLYMARLNNRIIIAQESLRTEINTREILEQQLMHAQKMESLGQLTGGIATIC